MLIQLCSTPCAQPSRSRMHSPPCRPRPAPQACSQLLSTALSSGLCNGEDLPVTGVNSDALEAVVRFFYEGRVLLTLGNAVAVMDAAQRLQVRSVAEAARGYVQSMLSARTAVALMVEALQYDLEDLADECLANAVLK